MKKLFALLLLISSPAFCQTVKDTVLPDGTIQHTSTSTNVTVYSTDQYEAMIQNYQGQIATASAQIKAMQPILDQAKAAKANAPTFILSPANGD